MTVEELNAKAEKMRNSIFSNGEQILFCVDYGFYLSNQIHSELFSKPEHAIEFASTFSDKDYTYIYPVFDIWNNPTQVDRCLKKTISMFDYLAEKCEKAMTNKERCELINRISKAYTDGLISENEDEILIDIIFQNAERYK